MKLSLKILSLLAFASILAAQPKLKLTVHTGHGQVGYDVNSTLISGEKDMIVIDPQFSLSEAHKLAAEILESKKNLTIPFVGSNSNSPTPSTPESADRIAGISLGQSSP